MSKFLLIAGSMLVASTVSALAHTPSKSSIDARQKRQLGAIEQGRQSGSITWTEGIKLRALQKSIARKEARLAADGRLSRSDRRYLTSLQDGAYAEIQAEKSDRRRRLRWLPRVGR